jgi:hypothetical protein
MIRTEKNESWMRTRETSITAIAGLRRRSPLVMTRRQNSNAVTNKVLCSSAWTDSWLSAQW